ncbi:MAG: hypothetical protein HYT30_00100 [Parcubacteria group bacterium]|nr:hypothetical protein [Parcubacteria group bacterium]
MIDTYSLLVIAHLFGAALGIGGATFIEVFLNLALRDGKVDPTEKLFLTLTYKVLRFGLIISLITGLGFLVFYFANNQLYRMTNPVFISKMLVIVILVANAYLLHIHKMKLWWGSTLSFMSWYFAFFLGTFLTHSIRFGFWEIMIAYVVFVVAGGYVLEAIRERSKRLGMAAAAPPAPSAPNAPPMPPAAH